ncbi:MAG TPA: RHS repeat-associated core domain-containing protein [Terriglobales bacterium]|nr:RHS repeat-associated core domain-containing protein [Terriglobales bacterium]
MVWDGQFEPFGQEHGIAGSITAQLRFPGQYYDPETQLSQNWHREYDPTLGRYVESDPVGLMGGINTYVYVTANPIVGTDPSGEAGPIGVVAGARIELGPKPS